MALNSFITEEGLEMGRAQVMQAEAAGIRPSVHMNPILLKPTNDVGSQVIVGGNVLGNMSARDYFSYKKSLIPQIAASFAELEKQADIIVIEGAGSPAEINLKADDIVNMGLAELVDAPVLLVGDIDRGGVFAQLLGTLMLLEDEERARVKGLIINKFRGDKTILDPGIAMLEERGGVRVAGIVPYMQLALEDEDSLSAQLEQKQVGCIDLAVIRLPRISNFTDFNVFEQLEGVSVRYVGCVQELGNPDMIFLPGSKNTMGDMKWMRQNGLEAAVKKQAGRVPIWGICGGYQMLGQSIEDPEGVEESGFLRGMALLSTRTVLRREKTRRQVCGHMMRLEGALAPLSGMKVSGYEIHMGETMLPEEECAGQIAELYVRQADDKGSSIYGSYVHGIFDEGKIAVRLVEILAKRKGIAWSQEDVPDYRTFKEQQYDKLAQGLRENMDMDFVYSVLREAHMDEGLYCRDMR
jgi:adenosylcobyric acid synthase